MATPAIVPVAVILAQLDEMNAFVQTEIVREHISTRMGEAIKKRIQLLKKNQARHEVHREVLKTLLACAKRQANEGRGSPLQNVCSCKLCKEALDAFEDDSPIRTPDSWHGSTSTAASQTGQTKKGDSKDRDQILLSILSHSKPDSESIPQQNHDLDQATPTANDEPGTKIAGVATSNDNNSEINTRTMTYSIHNMIPAATPQAAFDILGMDIDERLKTTASSYLIFELLVSMPVGISTPVRLACMMFIFAIITWKKSRELVLLGELLPLEAEDLWRRQEITLLNTWVLAMVGLGLMVCGWNVPYYET